MRAILSSGRYLCSVVSKRDSWADMVGQGDVHISIVSSPRTPTDIAKQIQSAVFWSQRIMTTLVLPIE